MIKEISIPIGPYSQRLHIKRWVASVVPTEIFIPEPLPLSTMIPLSLVYETKMSGFQANEDIMAWIRANTSGCSFYQREIRVSYGTSTHSGSLFLDIDFVQFPLPEDLMLFKLTWC